MLNGNCERQKVTARQRGWYGKGRRCSRAAISLPWQRLHLPWSHLQPLSQNINDFQQFYDAAFTLVSPLAPSEHHRASPWRKKPNNSPPTPTPPTPTLSKDNKESAVWHIYLGLDLLMETVGHTVIHLCIHMCTCTVRDTWFSLSDMYCSNHQAVLFSQQWRNLSAWSFNEKVDLLSST